MSRTGYGSRVAAMAAAGLLALSAAACEQAPSSSPGASPNASGSATAWCRALPSVPVALLPRVHDKAATDGDARIINESFLETFVKKATAYGGDRFVGRAAWWAGPLDTSDLLTPIDGTHLAFAGRARERRTGEPTGRLVVGVTDVHGGSGSWARQFEPAADSDSDSDTVRAVLDGATLVVSAVHPLAGSAPTNMICGMDARTGQVRWGAAVATGAASVRLVVTSRAIVAVADDVTVVALDRQNGRELWRAKSPDRASVTAAGGQIVLGPTVSDEPDFRPEGLGEVRALDLRDGHVAWHVPVPPSTASMRHFWSVIATEDGQPVVVQQSDQRQTSIGGQFPAGDRVVAYGPAGAVLWQLPATRLETVSAPGDQLLLSKWVPDGKPNESKLVVTVHNLRDGSEAWHLPTPSDGVARAYTASQMFLVDAGRDGRSLRVDRRTGAATPVLADCLSCVGKMGIDNSADIAGGTLVIGGSDGATRTAVGFPLR